MMTNRTYRVVGSLSRHPTWMIRSRREQLGIAQLELASMAGIDPGKLSKIERGTRRSPLDTYLKLCGILGIDLFAETRP